MRALPPHATVPPEILYFLNTNLSSKQDLDGASALLSELRIQCDALDGALSQLSDDLRSHLTRHSSHSDRVGSLFQSTRSQLRDLRQYEGESSGTGTGTGTGEELHALAKEVARVETVRNYAETALKLDTVVGDIEDAVSSTMNATMRRHPSKRSSQNMCAGALKALKSAEDVLRSVAKKHPQWTRLVSAADHRIDRALAILRPQAIADHRALLTSLGWPPPLSTLGSSAPDSKASTHVQNPLFTLQGDLKTQYCESFLSLCGLQELQRQRKSRQLEGHYKDVSLHQPLWAIEELVNPISIASQRHFSKWIEKPEYIFALVFKITRDYVDSMDDLLQPLVDEAKLSAYSCREEWISAMVSSLSTYLAKEIFPSYVAQLNKESEAISQTQARISWLHLVDLMIAFDKQVHSLAANSGLNLSLQEDDNMQKMSSFIVFCDRPDWLDIWAEIELTDALQKLKSQMEDDRSWINESQEASSVVSGQEDTKSPLILSVVIRLLSSVIERCRSLPTVLLRSRFVKLTAAPLIHKFLDCMLQRCQEAEGLTALTDDTALTKVAKSINAAFYFEAVLKKWCVDVLFVEIGSDQSGESQNSVFYEEIKRLEEFRTEWIEKLSTVVLRGFDARCRDYIKNKKQWQERSEEALTLSRSFIGAMDYLQGKLLVLEEALNKMYFPMVWRSVAGGIDRLIFSGILMGNVKFNDGGVERLWNDLNVLFGIFGGWCLRPQGFFPKVNEGVKLLQKGNKNLNSLILEERWLKENGIRHLKTNELEKILKNRVYK